MSTEVLIISAAADFGSQLGTALAQRGAYRVALVRDGDTALAHAPQGLVLLDCDDEAARQAFAQRLLADCPGLAVHFTPQAAGIEGALAQVLPADPEPEAFPLEPLAGDESDSRSWRYVREPVFLREYDPASPEVAAAVAPEATPEDGQSALALEAETDVTGHALDAGKEDAPAAGLERVAQETGSVLALLTRDGQDVARAGQVDALTEASVRALGANGMGSQAARHICLVDRVEPQESCLLYVGNAGALQLAVLAPDDCSVRTLRCACDRMLESLAQARRHQMPVHSGTMPAPARRAWSASSAPKKNPNMRPASSADAKR